MGKERELVPFNFCCVVAPLSRAACKCTLPREHNVHTINLYSYVSRTNQNTGKC